MARQKCRPFKFCFEQDGESSGSAPTVQKDVYKDILASPEIGSDPYLLPSMHGFVSEARQYSRIIRA